MGGSKKAMLAAVAAVVLIGAVVGAALLYANRGPVVQAPPVVEAPKSELARFAVGPLASLQTPGVLEPAPDYVFKDRENRDVRFADFRGKIVVVNLWAMWCAPCRTEMPTIARLAQNYVGQDDVVILPINVDATPDALADARSFIDVHEPLPLYSDIRFQLPFEFPGKGAMPRTIFLDRQGRIRAVFAGEADWASAQARALIDALLAEDADTPSA